MFAIIDRYSDEHFHFIELLVHGDMTVYRKAQQYEDSSWQVQGKDGIWEDEPLFNNILVDAYDPSTMEPDGALWMLPWSQMMTPQRCLVGYQISHQRVAPFRIRFH